MQPFLLIIALNNFVSLTYATIVGENAAEDQFGFQAAILDNGLCVCTGSIITNYFIVTAAHCFKRGRDASLINVQVGSTEVSNDNVKNVSEIITHPRYYENTRDFDIALIRLAEELPLSDETNIKVINLVGITDEYVGDATAIGWHPPRDATPDITLELRYTQLNVWKRKDCNSFNIWGPAAHYYFAPLISERMICASVPNGAAGTCDLDDGGPLIDSNNELLGILSWRYDCLSKTKPSVYINIPLLSPWILRVIQNYDQ